MADPSHTTLSSSELGALADRLYSRGISKIGEFTVEQSRDLRIASRAIRELLSQIDRAASISGDLAHTLHNLRISVEG
jgi:hypothetical protein